MSFDKSLGQYFSSNTTFRQGTSFTVSNISLLQPNSRVLWFFPALTMLSWFVSQNFKKIHKIFFPDRKIFKANSTTFSTFHDFYKNHFSTTFAEAWTALQILWLPAARLTFIRRATVVSASWLLVIAFLAASTAGGCLQQQHHYPHHHQHSTWHQHIEGSKTLMSNWEKKRKKTKKMTED